MFVGKSLSQVRLMRRGIPATLELLMNLLLITSTVAMIMIILRIISYDQVFKMIDILMVNIDHETGALSCADHNNCNIKDDNMADPSFTDDCSTGDKKHHN